MVFKAHLSNDSLSLCVLVGEGIKEQLVNATPILFQISCWKGSIQFTLGMGPLRGSEGIIT